MRISPRRFLAAPRLLPAVLFFALASSQHVDAQVSSDTLPASLLLRAASAAASVRTGGIVFVALCREPQQILGVYADRFQAIDVAGDAGETCSVLPVQSEPQTSTVDPVPASLAYRWAEAADAFRTGSPVWVEAEVEYPHVVREIYTDPDSARAGEGTALSGALIAAPDFGATVGRSLPCPHLKRPFSLYPPDCRDLTGIPSLPLDSIVDITLEVRSADSLFTWTFSPDVVDAIFFSMSAFDRFVAPYYARSYGVDYAQRLRESLRPGWLGIPR